MLSRFLERILFLIQRRWLKTYLSAVDFTYNEVLDIGCGRGWYAELFPQNYTGIDIDAEAIESARKDYPYAEFVIMSADRLSFPDEKFALVFCNAILHHLDDEGVAQAFKEMIRVTKHNGKILIIDIVLPKKWQWFGRWVFKLDKGAKARTTDGLVSLLSQAGLTTTYINEKRFLNLEVVILEYRR
ncbi:MAG: class I SAM-dependent methyltransferase [bacterium]|nr:class I SAM-dependent methyltransferase [bacterium]